MVDLFIDRVLVKNNREQDELDTEREVAARLQNRILMLFFASAACESCQQFAPTLKDFFKQLTDEFYVDRSAQLVLLYIRYSTTHTHLQYYTVHYTHSYGFTHVGSCTRYFLTPVSCMSNHICYPHLKAKRRSMSANVEIIQICLMSSGCVYLFLSHCQSRIPISVRINYTAVHKQ